MDFLCVKIYLDANAKLADKYGVQFLPNIVLTDSWGNALVFHRGFGRRGDADIVEKLRSVPKDFGEIKTAGDAVAAIGVFEGFLKDFPKSAETDRALFGIFSGFAQRNLLADAVKVLVELKSKFPQSGFIAQAEQNLEAYKAQAK